MGMGIFLNWRLNKLRKVHTVLLSEQVVNCWKILKSRTTLVATV